MKNFKNFLKDEDGQGMVEYALIIGLIAIVVVAGLIILGPKIKEMFTNIAGQLETSGTVS